MAAWSRIFWRRSGFPGSTDSERRTLMKGIIVLGATLWSLLLSANCPAEWKPARGPLMSRWAKNVTPDKVLPKYPRPQLVRKDWQNLNGLWQMVVAKPDEAPPTGKELGEQILVPFPVESALSG